MKIDELIQELEEVREEHGNLHVIIPEMEAGPLTNIEVGDLEIDLIGELDVKQNSLY